MEEKTFFEAQAKRGLDLVVEETQNFDRIVKGVYEITAREIYGSSKTPGLAVFAYGSPGRIELIGGDSDADILLVENERTRKSERFKKLLKQRLNAFNFSKVDMPDWGTFNEINTYLKKSLIEGNQILETRFVIGDSKTNDELNKKKKLFDSIKRGMKNIVFNRLYLNQYFRQKVKNSAPNIKYCKGGSRDFLFVYWHDKLDRQFNGEKEDKSYKPRIEVGLKRLFEQGKITERELEDITEAVNFMIVLRSDVLSLNKDTLERGLTFLDKNTAERLHMIGYPQPNEILTAFKRYEESINNLMGLLWNETINKAKSIKGQNWKKDFIRAYEPNIPLKDRFLISPNDNLTRIALIWGASESNQKELFDYLARKYKNTEDWTTIGSIVCSPLCTPEILHHFGTGILKEEGYGYLLRVVARNKNVKEETLKSIAYDKKLKKRYTEVAQAALNRGHRAAINQI